MIALLKRLFGSGLVRLDCPYCLETIELAPGVKTCPRCPPEQEPQDIPMEYITGFKKAPPLFVPVVGWPGVGKTVYLYALTKVLDEMFLVWPSFHAEPLSELTLEYKRSVRDVMRDGALPDLTPMGVQKAYIMRLSNLGNRWPDRTLVSRDFSGENFHKFKFPAVQLPFFKSPKQTAVIFMFSLKDMLQSNLSMDELLANYARTLRENGVEITDARHRRKGIIVLSKGDDIAELPENLREYLLNDPIAEAIRRDRPPSELGLENMAEYLERMERVSNEIRDWLDTSPPLAPSGRRVLNQAQQLKMPLRFSIISSTGTDPQKRVMTLQPRRVIDPFFWAMSM